MKKPALLRMYDISLQWLRLGTVNEAGRFRDSEYQILLKVTKPAFALSSLPLAFCFVHAKKKTDITSIKSNSKKAMNLQQAITVTDSTFLLYRASEEILRERRGALLFLLCVSAALLKMKPYLFRKKSVYLQKKFYVSFFLFAYKVKKVSILLSKEIKHSWIKV